MKKILNVIFCLINSLQIISQDYIQPGFGIVPVCNGFTSSTAMAFLPDGRIVVTEQDGRVLLVKNGNLLPNPIFTFQTANGEDRGLMGVAVDPEFNINGFLYFYHTRYDNINNRISRITMAENSDSIISLSKITILDLDTIVSGWHNGGCMKFGIDGKLYVSIGDNGMGSEYSQSDESYWGKMLRINSDGSIPSGNPYTSGSEKRKRIWAKGLRNPYTFDVNKVNGQIFVNDVGHNTWEEINEATLPGRNFGWSYKEGFDSTFTYDNPIYNYLHSEDNQETDSTGACITGGVFFESSVSNYPSEYQGKYFFSNIGKWINWIDPSIPNSRSNFFFNSTFGGMTYLTLGTDGNIYFFDRQESSLKKIVYVESNIPVFVSSPMDTSVILSNRIRLQAFAVSTSPEEITYSWYKNGNLTTQTTFEFDIWQASTNSEGNYYCKACNSFGCVDSPTFFLEVLPYNETPQVTIDAPANLSFYRGGDTIYFSGSAIDVEDGQLPLNTFTWSINFHHDDHIHPSGIAAFGTNTGFFVIPTIGELADDVFYTITLQVTDSDGLIGMSIDTIYPYIKKITFNADPQGIPITIDAPNIITPHEINATVGYLVNAIAPDLYYDEQLDQNYYFDKWDNSDQATISFYIPENNLELTARYKEFKEGIDLNFTTMNAVNCAFYDDVENNLLFSNLTPSSEGFTQDFQIYNTPNTVDFGVIMESYLQIDSMGLYKFYIQSNGKSTLTHINIGNFSDLIVSNTNSNLQFEEKEGMVGLKTGKHKLRFKYANSTNELSFFKIFYEGPGIMKQEIPNSKLFVLAEDASMITDQDLDGLIAAIDCNDLNPSIHPGATEIPDNGIDENCDGIDATNLVDIDGDGYLNNLDCDDFDATKWYLANMYADNDGDTKGAGPIVSVCRGTSLPAGYRNNNTDCDDTDPTIWIEATKYVDNDLDGLGAGELVAICKGSSLPVGYSNSNTDCDDTNSSIFPNAVDLPDNEIDENCDGVDATTASIFDIKSHEIKLFPNPGDKQVTIKFGKNISSGQLKIYSALGSIVFEENFNDKTVVQINTNKLESGIYYVEISDSQTRSILKWVKK